jgi:hypothetical protein
MWWWPVASKVCRHSHFKSIGECRSEAMKKSIMRASGTLAITAFVICFSSESACGQVTVTTVQTSAPAVVGYAARPYGLFGLRTAYQPIVANVPVQRTVTVQRTPAYVPQPVTVQRAYVPAPVAVQRVYVPAPVAVPAPIYLAPIPPTPIPVTTYYTPLYPRY